MLTLSIFLLLLGVSCEKQCPDHETCMSFDQCQEPHEETILFPCPNTPENTSMVCCPLKVKEISEYSNLGVFPKDCGVAKTTDKIVGGRDAGLGQFPWMVLLGYKQRNVPFTEYLCAGTVISRRFVLTAAHCAVITNRELVSVRLGEHDQNKDPDCITKMNKSICAPRHIEIRSDLIYRHAKYNLGTLQNDIALVKLQRTIDFNDWIQPICLPFKKQFFSKDLIGEKVTISGWGKNSSKSFSGSTILQMAIVKIRNQSHCNGAVPARLSDQQLCANGNQTDACLGDSGGPMMKVHFDVDLGEVKYTQVGVISYAIEKVCGVTELPAVYSRVDRYLDWITQLVDE